MMGKDYANASLLNWSHSSPNETKSPSSPQLGQSTTDQQQHAPVTRIATIFPSYKRARRRKSASFVPVDTISEASPQIIRTKKTRSTDHNQENKLKSPRSRSSTLDHQIPPPLLSQSSFIEEDRDINWDNFEQLFASAAKEESPELAILFDTSNYDVDIVIKERNVPQRQFMVEIILFDCFFSKFLRKEIYFIYFFQFF